MNPESSFSLRRVPISSCLRALFCLGMALIACVSSKAQVLLQINVTNPAAVTFTATNANSAITYSGTSNTSPEFSGPIGMGDGISLIGFFQHDVNAFAFGGDGSGQAVSSTLAMGTVGGVYFDQAVTWKDTDYANNVSDARDLNFFHYLDNNTVLSFSTSSTALTGVMTYDFTSGVTSHTADLPTVGMSGSIVIPYGVFNTYSEGIIGTWVVVSAIPEPSTYAALFGATALMGAVALRRRIRREA